MLDMPYFMQNEKWYRFDEKKRKFVLTKDAPESAIYSYKKFEAELKKQRNSMYK